MIKFLLFFIFPLFAFSQNTTQVKQLTNSEIEEKFPAEVLEKLGIKYPIYRIYTYEDKEGKHFWILTENQVFKKTNTGKIIPLKYKNDIINDKIKAFHLLEEENSFKIVKTIYDFRPDNQEYIYSIWFWTKYISLTDLDNDGYIDPIIIYGIVGDGDFSYSTVKILTYYKGNKIAIRHYNGVLDDERKTQIDTSFHSLPKPIREKIYNTIQFMEENNHSVFDQNVLEKLIN